MVKKSKDGQSVVPKEEPPKATDISDLLCTTCGLKYLSAQSIYGTEFCEICREKLSRWCGKCKRLYPEREIIQNGICIVCRRGLPEVGTIVRAENPGVGIVFFEGDKGAFFSKLRRGPNGWTASSDRTDTKGLMGIARMDLSNVPVIKVTGHAKSFKSVFVDGVSLV